jgi:hypothetical protein
MPVLSCILPSSDLTSDVCPKRGRAKTFRGKKIRLYSQRPKVELITISIIYFILHYGIKD